jgi:hypothetical protein
MSINTISPTVIETSVLIGDVTNTPAQGSLPTMTTTDDGEVVSAALEIQSTAGALLLPRMTTVEQDALTASEGMVIYNTTGGSIYFNNGNNWVDTGGDVSSSSVGASTQGNVAVFADTSGLIIEDGGASFQQVVAVSNRSSISQDMVTELSGIAHVHFNDSTNYGFILVNDNLGIGLYQNTLEDSSSQINVLFTGSSQTDTISSVNALVELQSTTGALLVSRMTSTERDALESPQDGMILYNTTIPAFNMRENSSWITIGTVTSVAATTSSTGLTITGSPITTSGTLTFTLGTELQGLAGLSTTGLVNRTGTGTYSTASLPLSVSNGGTGASTLTSHGVLVGAGTSAVTQISVGSMGTVLIGNSGADPSFSATPSGLTSIGVGNLSLSSSSVISTVGHDLQLIAGNAFPSSNNIYLSAGGYVALTGLNEASVPLRFYDSTNTYYSAFKAGTLSTSTTWTLPTADSTGSQFLQSNGSGTLSWASAVTSIAATTSSTGLSISGSPITSSGTFTFTLGTELQGLAGLSTTGLVQRTGSGTYTTVSTPLSLTNGGTNASLTASNGGIFYSTASAGAILNGTATANQVLLSGSSAAPSWSTATYPSTTTINQLLYSSSANTIAGLATANNGVLITSSGGVPSISSTLPSAVQGNITSLGTIASGIWNGSTLGVAYGGTGNSSATAYAVLCGGTTSTGAYQSIASVGTSGQLLTSNGAGALPSFQTYTGTSSITTVGTVTSGTWNGSLITGTYGGTGVNNGSKTITLGGNLTTSGAYNLTFTLSGTTSLTLPTSGSLVAGPGSSTSGNISTFNNTSGTLLADSGLNLLVSSGSAYIFMDTSKNTVNTGSSITSYGVNCLRNNTTGSYNSGFGNICLQNNSSGYNNSGFGYQCLNSSTSGHDNSGFGFNSLYGCTTGTQNSGFGSGAAQNVSTGAENSAFGNSALKNTSTASFNTAMGSGCLSTNTTGASNTAVGQASLNNNSTGSNSSAFGIASLYNSTTASNNCSFGYFSMYNNTTGASNCSFGYNAGRNYTTNNSCTFIGYSADSSVNNLTNSCAIGANTAVGVSNAIVLGNGCYVGIGKNSPAYALQLGTDNSSTPLLYIASASVPSAPGTANDGIYSVATGKPTFTSGTAKYSGTIATVTSGSAATAGQSTLNGTTGVTITTSAIATTSIVVVTHSTGTGAPTLANLGTLTVGSISAGTSFVIYSSNALDTVTVNWFLINP